jgi:hypothetical protein
MLTAEPPARRTNGLRRPPEAPPIASPPPPPKPRKRRVRWGRVFTAVGLLVFGIVALVRGCNDEPAQPPPAAVVPEEPETPRVLDCRVYPYKHFSKKLRDRLPQYKELSLRAGVRPVADEKALAGLVSQGRSGLVPVESNEAFWIAPMAHGRPYLTPEARNVLHSIARDFRARIADTDLKGTRIKVTSLFRTRKDQRDLGRSNVNATRDLNAPHTHGTSMDLSYMKFVDQAGQELKLAGCQQVFLAETLAEVIAEHRKHDKFLFATREAQQACYHLSVCR